MDKIYFNNYEEIVYSISEAFDMFADIDNYSNFSVIAKYDEAKEIVTELIFNGYEPISINLCSKDANGYDKEYVVTAVDNDGEYEIWCQEFNRDGNYMDDYSLVTYIFDNCSSKCIPHLLGGCVFEVSIGEDECECEHECACEDNCECCCENEFETANEVKEFNEITDDTHGFTVSKSDENGYSSFSFYSSEELTKEDVSTLLKRFGF